MDPGLHRLRVHNRDGVHLHPLPHAEGKQEQTGAGQQVIWQTFFKTKRDDQKFKLVRTFKEQEEGEAQGGGGPGPDGGDVRFQRGGEQDLGKSEKCFFIYFYVQVNCVSALFFAQIVAIADIYRGGEKGPFPE